MFHRIVEWLKAKTEFEIEAMFYLAIVAASGLLILFGHFINFWPIGDFVQHLDPPWVLLAIAWFVAVITAGKLILAGLGIAFLVLVVVLGEDRIFKTETKDSKE